MILENNVMIKLIEKFTNYGSQIERLIFLIGIDRRFVECFYKLTSLSLSGIFLDRQTNVYLPAPFSVLPL